MDINASAIAAQTAQIRQDASLGFVKKNTEVAAQIADVVTEGAANGQALSSSGGKGSIVDILA